METEQTNRLVTRCTERLKNKITTAEKLTGLKESVLIRAAVETFFEAHHTPDEIIVAVASAQFRVSASAAKNIGRACG